MSDQGIHNFTIFIWAAERQNQQYGRCAQWRRRSAWASVQSNQSWLCAQWVANDPMLLHADSESDQAGWKPRLSWTFVGRTGHFVCFVLLRCIWLAHSANNQTEKVIAYGYHVALNNILLLLCQRLFFIQDWALCNYFVLQLGVLHPDAFNKNIVDIV